MKTLILAMALSLPMIANATKPPLPDAVCDIFLGAFVMYIDMPDDPHYKAIYEDRISQAEKMMPGAREKCVAEIKADRAEYARLQALPGVKIGMTADEVINQTSWGKPRDVHRTVTAKTITEQWIYDGSYLYFTNGKLTGIQN